MNLRSKIASFATASIIALGIGTGAVAQSVPTVSQEITGGDFTYSLGNGTMDAIVFDYTKTTATTTNGEVLLEVDDARGTSEGWSVSISSGAFEYSGDAVGGTDHNIPAANLSVAPAAPTLVAGESGDGVTAGAGGSLDASRLVINAAAGSGSGKFSQSLPLALTVPALSPTGTYTATLTVSTTSAPGL